MDNKTEQVVQLAMAYMEELEDMVGGRESDTFVIDLVNDVYSVLAETEEPLLKLRYEERNYDETDEIDTKPNSISNKSNKYINNETFTDEVDEGERVFPHITPEMEEDIKDAMVHVHNVFSDISFALEVSEEDNESLQEENKRLAMKNENLLKQAKALYNRNEYLDLHNRNLQETIDDIFTKATDEEPEEDE